MEELEYLVDKLAKRVDKLLPERIMAKKPAFRRALAYAIVGDAFDLLSPLHPVLKLLGDVMQAECMIKARERLPDIAKTAAILGFLADTFPVLEAFPNMTVSVLFAYLLEG